MSFKLNQSGNLSLVKRDILKEMNQQLPLTSSTTLYTVDIPHIVEKVRSGKNYVKNMEFLQHKAFSFVPLPILGAITHLGSQGIFWKAFLVYIFPWMLDIAKVYCCIRIAQAFYQEKRGGREDGSALSSFLQYGKWYLFFWLLPIGVELLDEIGGTIFQDLQKTKLTDIPTGTEAK